MKNIVLVVFLLSSLLGACTVKSGHQVLSEMTDSDISANLIKGQTTKEKTQILFGEPTKTHSYAGGKEIWVYDIVKGKGRGFSVFNTKFGRQKATNAKVETLKISFDKDNIIENYTFSNIKTEKIIETLPN